jgi:tripartite-type tricarboxylate transporter receptor subunit TctC
MPDVKERFAALAIDTAAIGPQEFTKIIEADVKRWREVVTKSGLRIE